MARTYETTTDDKDLPEVTSGNDFYRQLELTQDGSAIDISGWTITFVVKDNESVDDADAPINKSITSHTDAVNGKSQLELSQSETQQLSEGEYMHYIEVDTGSQVWTVNEGGIYVNET